MINQAAAGSMNAAAAVMPRENVAIHHEQNRTEQNDLKREPPPTHSMTLHEIIDL